MVEWYDESRIVDTGCLNAAVGYLANSFPPSRFRRLLEPGIGTGRIAIPFAENGFEVAGVDISGRMLAVLRKRMAESGRALPLAFGQADAASLPFPAGCFDIAVAVHLFYFIGQWKMAVDELLRVVRPGGPLILMHTGMGMEVPSLNTRYKEICAENGCVIEPVGAASTREVVDHLSLRGCRADWVKDRWQWVSKIRFSEAIFFLRKRAYSFTTVATDPVHSSALAQIEVEVTAEHGSLTAEAEVPNQVSLVVVLRQ